MGSGKFQVILGDLQSASSTFHQESQTYAAIVPKGGPPCPDGGDASINGMMQCVTEAFAALHLAIAGTIDGHGDKLTVAHDNYQECEVSMRELYDDLATPESVQPGPRK